MIRSILKRLIHNEWIIFSFLLIVGTFLRTYALDHYPAGFHGDEASAGLEARRILQDGFIGFWSPAALGTTALHYYWVAFLYMMFGQTVPVTRLAFSLLNIATIPFFYFTARIVGGRWSATVATFLLITNQTILAFTRRADLPSVNYAFFPAIFFFLYALNKKKLWPYIGAGICLGLMHHTYYAYWFTPLIFFSTLIYLFVTKHFSIQEHARPIMLMVLAYLLFASPMLHLYYTDTEDIFGRSRTVSIFSESGITHARSYLGKNATIWSLLQHNISKTLLLFFTKPSADPWDTFHRNPALDPVTASFFVIGFVLTCFRMIKKRELILIIVLFFFFLAGSIFNTDAPSYRRSQGSIYLAFLFAGVGYISIIQFVRQKIPRMSLFFLFVAVSFLGYTGIMHTRTYFRNNAISPSTKAIMGYHLVEIVRYLTTHAPDAYVYSYIPTSHWKYETIQFLLPDTPGEDRSEKWGTFSLERTIYHQPVVYIFRAEYLARLPEVTALHPGGESFIKRDADGSIVFGAYLLQ